MLTLIGLQLLTNRDFRVRELLTTGSVSSLTDRELEGLLHLCVCVCVKKGCFLLVCFILLKQREMKQTNL